MLQHLLLLAYGLPSWPPFRRCRTWQDERKRTRRHHKRLKDIRNQEGRECKEDVHKKHKAHLFGIFISALLSEVLHLCLFSKTIDGWLPNIVSFNSDTAWTWFDVWVLPFTLCNFVRVITSDQNSYMTQTLASICFHCCQVKNHIREKHVWRRRWTENMTVWYTWHLHPEMPWTTVNYLSPSKPLTDIFTDRLNFRHKVFLFWIQNRNEETREKWNQSYCQFRKNIDA